MRIPSGSTDRWVKFVAVDATDLKTRETALTSFTVYYELDNGAVTLMTTPTVVESSAANMPGHYRLLIDESGMTTLAAGHDTEELSLHITHAGMAPVTRVIEITTIPPTAAAVADAIWDELQADHVTVGSFGEIATEIADILTDTADLQANQGSWLTATGFATSAALATAQADLDKITGTDGVTLATAQALYTPAKAGDAMTLTAAADLAIADALLKRDMSAVSGEAARSPLNALRILRNKWTIVAGTFTSYKEDDSTTAWTSVVTTDAAADPIDSSDPA